MLLTGLCRKQRWTAPCPSPGGRHTAPGRKCLAGWGGQTRGQEGPSPGPQVNPPGTTAEPLNQEARARASHPCGWGSVTTRTPGRADPPPDTPRARPETPEPDAAAGTRAWPGVPLQPRRRHPLLGPQEAGGRVLAHLSPLCHPRTSGRRAPGEGAPAHPTRTVAPEPHGAGRGTAATKPVLTARRALSTDGLCPRDSVCAQGRRTPPPRANVGDAAVPSAHSRAPRKAPVLREPLCRPRAPCPGRKGQDGGPGGRNERLFYVLCLQSSWLDRVCPCLRVCL